MSTFVPKEFYCPITGDLMKEPVSDPNGHTYEKSSIIHWLSIRQTSPITQEPLNVGDLTDNIAMKRSIDEIREKITEEQMSIERQVRESEEEEYVDVLDDSIIDMKSYYMNDKMFININVPDTEYRKPVDIVLCIDISGSMGTEATLKDERNETVSHGYSILSLTVCAAKTILNSLNHNDNISIVTYSDRAELIVDYISCTIQNKKLIEQQLDMLRPTYTTNMWDGIQLSLDILREKSPDMRMKGILLLTDGIPNMEPPRGHEQMLERYFEKYNFRCGISSYGFGYNLNSELLMNLSNISGGDGYSFIPDASLLGNIFIHGISNILSNAVYFPEVIVRLKKGVEFKDGSQEINININSLKYGKSKNIILDVDTSKCSHRDIDYLRDSIDVELIYNGKSHMISECIMPPPNYYNEQLTRVNMIKIIEQSLQKIKYGDDSYKNDINEFVTSLETHSCQYISNILYDLTGQVKESLNMTVQGEQERWFQRWGLHYLLSLKTAYQNEICNNFKDKGVSNFSCGIFDRLRDEVSNIFDDIPPPKADVAPSVMRGGTSTRRSVAPVSMRTYNDQGGGCCSEGTNILMSDYNYKKVEDIVKGDSLVTYSFEENFTGYSVSKVECVIKTKCNDNRVNMVNINGVKITPYHPIILFEDINNKTWKFPIEVNQVEEIECEYMYTFVMENRQSIFIERNIFATYGHNLNDNIVRHEYFGTEKVISDLKSFIGYDNGLIELNQDNFIRNNDTNLIEKIA